MQYLLFIYVACCFFLAQKQLRRRTRIGSLSHYMFVFYIFWDKALQLLLPIQTPEMGKTVCETLRWMSELLSVLYAPPEQARRAPGEVFFVKCGRNLQSNEHSLRSEAITLRCLKSETGSILRQLRVTSPQVIRRRKRGGELDLAA